jgi:hypothetical protein
MPSSDWDIFLLPAPQYSTVLAKAKGDKYKTSAGENSSSYLYKII